LERFIECDHFFTRKKSLSGERNRHVRNREYRYLIIVPIPTNSYNRIPLSAAVNNTYDEQDLVSEQHLGRLAEWDGNTWTIVSTNAFYEVTGRNSYGIGAATGAGAENDNAVLAAGWDHANGLLMVRTNGTWQQYRLPKGSHT
jgi:hypothetical protein